MDTPRVHDDTLEAQHASLERLADAVPHGCYEGFVYIGYMQYEDEHGEPQEVIERVPCRRCSVEEG